VLRNAAADEITQASAESHPTSPARKIELMMRAQIEGDTEHGLVLMGQVASGLRELISVAEFVPAMAREAAELLHLLPVPAPNGDSRVRNDRQEEPR
jgi:NAD(P)H-dependent flavin oxidoreductase YrpB (nitropropane dioxygenase family)